MRQAILIILLIAGSLLAFLAYCAALIDWVQDAQTGVYERNHWEALAETLALVVYTYLAIRFIKRKSTFE